MASKIHSLFLLKTMLAFFFLSPITTASAFTVQLRDTSVSAVLYKTEIDFMAAHAKGDAISMAMAARNRAEVYKALMANRKPEKSPGLRAVQTSTRSMWEEAKKAANGNASILARIDRMFPTTTPAHERRSHGFGKLFGGMRKVDITIGLEMDATVKPNAPFSKSIPVSATTGTTIYVQPIEAYVDQPIDLRLIVRRTSKDNFDDDNISNPVCNVHASTGRLPCYIPPVDFSRIIITLENNGKNEIPVIVFVSGNATSVETALSAD